MRRSFDSIEPQRGEIIRLKDSTRAGYFAPSELLVCWGRQPEALPQALTFRAFGASFE
jgi:hypothetical protein